MNFFYGQKPHKDDCAVIHFRILPEFTLRFPDIPETKEAEEVRGNLNKRLAHLTATRWRNEAPDFGPYQSCFPEIEQMIDAFQNALPANIQRVFTHDLEARKRR